MLHVGRFMLHVAHCMLHVAANGSHQFERTPALEVLNPNRICRTALDPVARSVGLQAACDKHHATRDMQHATRTMRHATCNTPLSWAASEIARLHRDCTGGCVPSRYMLYARHRAAVLAAAPAVCIGTVRTATPTTNTHKRIRHVVGALLQLGRRSLAHADVG